MISPLTSTAPVALTVTLGAGAPAAGGSSAQSVSSGRCISRERTRTLLAPHASTRRYSPSQVHSIAVAAEASPAASPPTTRNTCAAMLLVSRVFPALSTLTSAAAVVVSVVIHAPLSWLLHNYVIALKL